MTGDGAAIGRAQPHRLRLGDEIADRQHQPVLADHGARPGAFGAEGRGGERVVGHARAQPDDREQGALQVESAVARVGLQLRRNVPVGLL